MIKTKIQDCMERHHTAMNIKQLLIMDFLLAVRLMIIALPGA